MLFIVFEGLNGAGKSSLAQAIALKLNGHYITSPHQDISQLRASMDDASLPAHFFYYMLGNILISDDLKKNKEKEIVVCDRYIDSTIARHEVLGLKVKDFDLKQFDLQEASISFFVYCEETERRKRINNRGKKNKWDLLDEDDTLRTKYVEYFRQKNNFYFFDTSYETEKESLDRITSILSDKCLI